MARVAERKDVLSTLFWMLTLLAYARYVEESKVHPSEPGSGAARSPKSGVFYVAALVCFALGLMAKPMIVTLPCVLLLLDYWPLGRMNRHQMFNLLLEKAPFFALAAIASAVTFAVQKNVGAVAGLTTLTFPLRLENAAVAYAGYLGKLFYPAGLCVFYPLPRHWPLGKTITAAVVLIAISVFAAVLWRRRPWLLVGWLWFVGTLVPVIGLVQVGAQAMADRYTYVSSVGMLILTIWGAHELTRRWRHHAGVLSVAGVAAIILCFVSTRQQLGYWWMVKRFFGMPSRSRGQILWRVAVWEPPWNRAGISMRPLNNSKKPSICCPTMLHFTAIWEPPLPARNTTTML